MTHQTTLSKIKFGFGALLLAVAMASLPVSAQAAARHHRHHHLVNTAQQPPAQPAACIHMQLGCP